MLCCVLTENVGWDKVCCKSHTCTGHYSACCLCAWIKLLSSHSDNHKNYTTTFSSPGYTASWNVFQLVLHPYLLSKLEYSKIRNMNLLVKCSHMLGQSMLCGTYFRTKFTLVLAAVVIAVYVLDQDVFSRVGVWTICAQPEFCNTIIMHHQCHLVLGRHLVF